MLKNVNFTLNKPIRVPNYAKLRRNQCSGIVPPLFAPPLLPPLSYKCSQGENLEKIIIFHRIHDNQRLPESGAPPFCPPFSQIRKVQNVLYILTIYHFPPKCFVLSVQSHFLKSKYGRARGPGRVLMRVAVLGACDTPGDSKYRGRPQ